LYFVYTINEMSKTLIIGTALIDHLIYSDSPLQENICNKVPNRLYSGGSMRNVAFNLGVLGCPVDFLAVWGDDFYGQQLQKELKEKGITCHGPVISQASPIFTALFNPAQNYLISSITPSFQITANYDFPYQNYDLLVSDVDDEFLYAQIISQNPQAKFVFSSFLPQPKYASHITGIILNRHEFKKQNGDENYQAMLTKYPHSWLVVTQDEMGVYYCHQGSSGKLEGSAGSCWGFPIGCGDAFTAGLLIQLLNNQDFPTAVKYGKQLADQLYLTPDNVITKPL